ncbi:MAG: hypothetical protein JWM41_786 [Gemmatimonadetes bacterium]|nr:hypothetical protein [Gemmatimonadota bacterium]
MAQFDIRSLIVGRTATAIARGLELDRPPRCRVRNGRFAIEFRGVGAHAWSTELRLQRAREVVAVTRAALRADTRTYMRRRADRAIVVTYEDEHVADGCTIRTRWSCVVPAQRGNE